MFATTSISCYDVSCVLLSWCYDDHLTNCMTSWELKRNQHLFSFVVSLSRYCLCWKQAMHINEPLLYKINRLWLLKQDKNFDLLQCVVQSAARILLHFDSAYQSRLMIGK